MVMTTARWRLTTNPDPEDQPRPPLLTNLSLTEGNSLRLLFKTIVFSTLCVIC